VAGANGGLRIYRDGAERAVESTDELDAAAVERYATDVAYTPREDEARAAVARGEAEAAFLLRPTEIEAVFARAREGQVMPQKTTYFFPKLTSGLLFQPLDD
jgi:uncharacterized protein (DUF1015 family)